MRRCERVVKGWWVIPSLCLALVSGTVGEEGQKLKDSQGQAGTDKIPTQAIFTNHLGMKLVPITGVKPLFSIWETRVSDYREFLKVTGRKSKRTYFKQAGTHPVVNVSWEDAIAFCRWLTRVEIESGLLPEGCQYRLPTSEQWSIAVGMAPASKDPLKELTVDSSASGYPWGMQWPAPINSGNYHPDLGADRFAATAPVGSFPANQFGLYDMGGNVWEWCQDQYGNSVDFRVLRGASWRMRSAGDLLSGFAVGNVTSLRLETYGFRVILQLPESRQRETLQLLLKSSGAVK